MHLQCQGEKKKGKKVWRNYNGRTPFLTELSFVRLNRFLMCEFWVGGGYQLICYFFPYGGWERHGGRGATWRGGGRQRWTCNKSFKSMWKKKNNINQFGVGMPIAAVGANYLPQCRCQLKEERIQTLNTARGNCDRSRPADGEGLKGSRRIIFLPIYWFHI